MKIVSLFLLILISCSNSQAKCPPVDHNNLKFNEEVFVARGFYSGQSGIIVSQTNGVIQVNGEACTIPMFKIKLEFENKLIDVDQRHLTTLNY